MLHIREQDARLPPRRPHRFPGTRFLRRIDGFPLPGALRLLEPRQVVLPRTPGRQRDARDFRFRLRRLPDIQPEGNARPGEQRTQPHQLVVRQRVHRIDDDRADPRRRAVVPEFQAAAHHRVEETLGLPGTGAGGNQRGLPGGDGADRLLLVPVEPRHLLRQPIHQVRMEQPFRHESGERRPRPKRPRQADVRPLEQRRPPRLVERQQLLHLRVQMRRGEGIRGELVPEETPHHLVGVCDRIQRHRRLPSRRRARRLRPATGAAVSEAEKCISGESGQKDRLPAETYRGERS